MVMRERFLDMTPFVLFIARIIKTNSAIELSAHRPGRNTLTSVKSTRFAANLI